jgi:HEAT repeat protein
MQTGFTEVRRSIQSVLGELKDPASIPVMMEIIEDDRFLPVSERGAGCLLAERT